jgi:hypothetical protein
MSFLTRLGNGHRELLFDRSRCFNFRRDCAQVFAKNGQDVTSALQPKGCQSAHPKADVANHFAAESLLQFPQDVDLGNLLELVV